MLSLHLPNCHCPSRSQVSHLARLIAGKRRVLPMKPSRLSSRPRRLRLSAPRCLGQCTGALLAKKWVCWIIAGRQHAGSAWRDSFESSLSSQWNQTRCSSATAITSPPPASVPASTLRSHSSKTTTDPMLPGMSPAKWSSSCSVQAPSHSSPPRRAQPCRRTTPCASSSTPSPRTRRRTVRSPTWRPLRKSASTIDATGSAGALRIGFRTPPASPAAPGPPERNDSLSQGRVSATCPPRRVAVPI